MPILAVGIIAGLVGAGGGFIAGNGVDGVSQTLKWVVIGAGGYFLLKQTGAIK